MDRLVQGVNSCKLGRLLALHGCNHDSMVQNKHFLVCLRLKLCWLYFLGKKVVSDRGHDLLGMVLFCDDPSGELVDVLEASFGVELSRLHDRLANSRSIFGHAFHAQVVGENSTWYLAMGSRCLATDSTLESQHRDIET